MEGLEQLREILQKKANFADEDLLLLVEKATFKQFEKGDAIIREGKIEKYLYFIVEGVARSFFYKEEKEICLEFFFTGSLFSSYASFLDQMPSDLNYEALTPLATMRIHYDDLQNIFKKNPKFDRLGRIMTEEVFKKSSERVCDLLSLSATERYQKLLNAYPQYVQNIPLKYLASYLNITPESLSRIRKG